VDTVILRCTHSCTIPMLHMSVRKGKEYTISADMAQQLLNTGRFELVESRPEPEAPPPVPEEVVEIDESDLTLINGIGRRTAQLLGEMEIRTFEDLLQCQADALAERLPRVTESEVTAWQQEIAAKRSR
jgi:hypothetical protein